MKRMFIVIALLALLMGAIVVAIISENPHEFSEGECLRCHVDPDNEPGRLTEPVTRLCKYCHKRVIMKISHPVDIFPGGITIPPDLPLRDGKIVCSTCHNIHIDRTVLFGAKTYFLRRPASDVKSFCLSCHEEDPVKPGHLLIITAHSGNRYRVTDPRQSLDPLSMECISCHDGSMARLAEYIIGPGVWKHVRDPHPIGVHYEKARMRRGGLAPVRELDHKIRLFAGRIGCGTCHDPYSTKPRMLVMKSSTELCKNCHINK